MDEVTSQLAYCYSRSFILLLDSVQTPECYNTRSQTPGNEAEMFVSIRVALIALLVLAGIFILAPAGILRSPPHDVEIVLSSYREDRHLVSQQIVMLRQLLAKGGWSSRVIVYSKDESLLLSEIEDLQKRVGADAIILLPNRGREGGTL